MGSFYDYDYYENGHKTGKSGYSNYRWLGQPTIQLAQAITDFCGINTTESILDYGCAKGFLVKALRISGFMKTFGCDISSYAIANCDTAVDGLLYLIDDRNTLESTFQGMKFDWIISKDVFEHVPISLLPSILKGLSHISKSLFIAVPLGDGNGNFIIPEYHNDQSHVTILSEKEWINLVSQSWIINKQSLRAEGIKDYWHGINEKGNLFLSLTSKEVH